MARTFNSTSSYLELVQPFPMPLKGTILVWFKPTWASRDGIWHSIYQFEHPELPVIFWKTNALYATNPPGISQFFWNGFRHWSDTNLDWAVLENARTGFTEHSDLFNPGEGALWQYSWDLEYGDSWAGKNGIIFGGLYGRGGFHRPNLTPPTISKIRIGSDGQGAANGDIAEFAVFNYQLSDEQRMDAMFTGIEGITPPPIYYNKILGNESPEPAVIGPPMTVVGSCPKAPHPNGFNPLGNRPVPANIVLTDKPPLTARPRPEHPLTEGLIWAMPFNQEAGAPRETVSNRLPTAIEKPPGYPDWFWEADGALHMKNLNIARWDNFTSFDALESFTLCMLTTFDLFISPSGPTFPFPNGGGGR